MTSLLDFLYDLFKNGNLGYSSLGTARSAISQVATIDGEPAGKHELVTKFMKSVFQSRPALPRNQTRWDPDIVLKFIEKLGPNEEIPTLMLSKKLTMLLLLQSGQRGQTIHLLDIRNMSLTDTRASFRIRDLLKTSRPGHHLSEVSFDAFIPNSRLCVVTTLRDYLARTQEVRGNTTSLLLTSRTPVRPASRDTIRRWTRDIMKYSGIDVSIFAPHSTRGASCGKAKLVLPIDTIIDTIGWSKDSVFRKFYDKPLCQKSLFSSVVMEM